MSNNAIDTVITESTPDATQLEQYFVNITGRIQSTFGLDNKDQVANVDDLPQLKDIYTNLLEEGKITEKDRPDLLRALALNYYSACLIAPAVHAWTAQVKRDYLAIQGDPKGLVIINRENSPFEYFIGTHSGIGKKAISLDLRTASLSQKAVQQDILLKMGSLKHIVLVDPSPYGKADLLAKILEGSQIIPRHFIFAGGMEVNNRVHMDDHKSFVPLDKMSGLDISTIMRLIEQGPRNPNEKIQTALNQASRLGYQTYTEQSIPSVRAGKLREIGIDGLINTILNIKVSLDQRFSNNHR